MFRNYNKIHSEALDQTSVKNDINMVEVTEINGQSRNISESEYKELFLHMPTFNEPSIYKVISNKLNVRKEPSKESEILCVLDIDSELLVENITNGWAHGYIEVGLKGYVMADFIVEVKNG